MSVLINIYQYYLSIKSATSQLHQIRLVLQSQAVTRTTYRSHELGKKKQYTHWHTV